MPHTADPELRAAFAVTAREISVVEAMPVGPGMIGRLFALRAAVMDANAAVRCAALWSAVISWAQAQRMVATVEVLQGVGPFASADPATQAQLAAQELALADHVPFAAAMAHLDLTRTVGGCLPNAWEAMDRGELSLDHVRKLHDAVRNASPQVIAAVEARVVPPALERGWTPSELRRAAVKALLVIDPDGSAERAAKARAAADLWFRAADDETAVITATGDALTLRQIYDTLDARATQLRHDGDPRNLGALRVAALSDAVLGTASGNDIGGAERGLAVVDTATGAIVDSRPRRTAAQRRAWARARRRGEALITIAATTLTGGDNQPGELAGYGPISAQTAREFTTDATLRRLLTDPLTGTALDLGRTRYRPSTELRRLIEALHLTCQMTGCTRPARQCDIDHFLDWLHSGRTDRANLHPLCRMHHQLKTTTVYTVTHDNHGHTHWTTPAGFTYTKRRDTYPTELLAPPTADEPPTDPASTLPEHDPDPPPRDAPLPDPPPLTDDEYDELHRALHDNHVDEHATRCYDTLRAAGLVA